MMKLFVKVRALILILIVYILPSQLYAQNYAKADSLALEVSRTQASSVEKLAAFGKDNFENQAELARFFYRWITKNIRYDINLMNKPPDKKPDATLVLKRKRAVCEGYSILMNGLCAEAGIQSVMVVGFSKGFNPARSSRMMLPDHAWNALYLNEKWYLLDVTWGAGYLEGGKFKRYFNDAFFMTEPDVFVSNHYPIDPVWQLLDYPRSFDSFYEAGQMTAVKKDQQISINYNDTIQAYLQLSEKERLINLALRALKWLPDKPGFPAINMIMYSSAVIDEGLPEDPFSDPDRSREVCKQALYWLEYAEPLLLKVKNPVGRQNLYLCRKNIKSMKQNLKALQN